MSSVKANDSHALFRTATARDVEVFADLVGDCNPVHLDEAFAATTRFGRRIAHGMLSAGLISAAIASGWPGAIYLSQILQFRAPAYLGDTITARVTVTAVRADKPIATFATECYSQDNTLLVGGEFVDSPTGRVWHAIRENEDRARMLGFNTFFFKLAVLIVAGITAGLAGMFNALYKPIVSPEIASVGFTVSGLLMLLISGTGTLSGAMVGAATFRLSDFYLDKWFGEAAGYVWELCMYCWFSLCPTVSSVHGGCAPSRSSKDGSAYSTWSKVENGKISRRQRQMCSRDCLLKTKTRKILGSG